jgi:hypothetical protein
MSVVPTHINSFMSYCNGDGQRQVVGGALVPASGAWTANTAIYIPLFLPWSYSVQRVFWGNGTAAGGNTDVGIYNLAGTTKLGSIGTTAVTGNTTIQYAALSVSLTQGMYWLAYAHDSATASQVFAAPLTAINGRMLGYLQQAVYPLGSTMTTAAYAALGLPLVGITNTSSGG